MLRRVAGNCFQKTERLYLQGLLGTFKDLGGAAFFRNVGIFVLRATQLGMTELQEDHNS